MNSKAAPVSCARRTRGAAPRPCPGCRSWSTDIWPGGESRADPSFVTRARVTPGCGNTYRKLTSASQLGVRNLTHRNNERNRTTDLKRLPALSEAQVQCRLSFRLSASYQPVRVLRGSAGHGRGSVYSTMVLLSAWRLAIALLIHPLCQDLVAAARLRSARRLCSVPDSPLHVPRDTDSTSDAIA